MDEVRMPERIGPFRVVRRLGAGGMAEAFLAVRDGPGGFEQQVCVKRVLPAYGRDDEFVRLFLREARLAARLSHRNVTRVVDFGQDGDSYFLALELVEGADLRRVLKAMPKPRLPIAAATLVGVEIAEALEHAHTRGGTTGPVVHRDVSPANILVSVDGDVKLTDFGISKAMGDARASRSDFVRGNIWYMAPEQLETPGVADPRSDLFSLGVVLYQCLAGTRPYVGATDLSAMMALSRGLRTPLLTCAPHVPPKLATIVDRLLEQSPDARFQTAAALVDALSAELPVPSARKELRDRVRESLRRPARGRAVVALPPSDQTEPVSTPFGAKPAEPAPEQAPQVEALTRIERRRPPKASARPAGWKHYNVAPGVWATAEARRKKPARRRWIPLALVVALLFATGIAIALAVRWRTG